MLPHTNGTPALPQLEASLEDLDPNKKDHWHEELSLGPISALEAKCAPGACLSQLLGVCDHKSLATDRAQSRGKGDGTVAERAPGVQTWDPLPCRAEADLFVPHKKTLHSVRALRPDDLLHPTSGFLTPTRLCSVSLSLSITSSSQLSLQAHCWFYPKDTTNFLPDHMAKEQMPQ